MTTEPRSAVKLEFAMSTAEVTVTAGVLFALRAAPSATTVTPSMPAAVPIWTVLPALTVVVATSVPSGAGSAAGISISVSPVVVAAMSAETSSIVQSYASTSRRRCARSFSVLAAFTTKK